MLFSNRTSWLALSVIAAVAVEVGCGGGTNNSKRGMSHSLRGTNGAITGTNGKKSLTTPQSSATDKANKAEIESEEKQLRDTTAHPTLAQEELAPGNYTLTTVQSVVHYMKTKPAEGLDASLTDNVDTTTDPTRPTFNPTAPIVSGSMTALDSQRDFVFPVKFSSNATQRFNGSQNVVLQSNYSQAANGISEHYDTATDTAASVAKILAANQTAGSTKDKQYISTTENGVKMYLRLMQVTKSTVRIYVSFEEQPATNAANETKTRNFYLDYSYQPDPSGGGSAGSAGLAGSNPATGTGASSGNAQSSGQGTSRAMTPVTETPAAAPTSTPTSTPTPESRPAPAAPAPSNQAPINNNNGPINNNLPAPSTDSSGTIQPTPAAPAPTSTPNSTLGG